MDWRVSEWKNKSSEVSGLTVPRLNMKKVLKQQLEFVYETDINYVECSLSDILDDKFKSSTETHAYNCSNACTY